MRLVTSLPEAVGHHGGLRGGAAATSLHMCTRRHLSPVPFGSSSMYCPPSGATATLFLWISM